MAQLETLASELDANEAPPQVVLNTPFYGELFFIQGPDPTFGWITAITENLWVALYLILIGYSFSSVLMVAGQINGSITQQLAAVLSQKTKMFPNTPFDDAKTTDLMTDYLNLAKMAAIAFASFLSTAALEQSASRLVAFFDLKTVEMLENYKKVVIDNDNGLRSESLLVDSITHNIDTAMYYLLALAI